MELIASATRDWGIGIRGGLVRRLKDDMRFFREKTAGSVVILGRATLESFPGGKPLKNRTHIVLSAKEGYSPEGVTVCASVPAALAEVKRLHAEKVFVIGGASVYRAFLPYCQSAYITRMDISAEADRFLPDLDREPGWELTDPGEEMECDGVSFRFTKYENHAVKEY